MYVYVGGEVRLNNPYHHYLFLDWGNKDFGGGLFELGFVGLG